ncbi:MAG: CtsR family transcriptional regulator [Clostridia bacterium]|nr:CtsR family transcriptional regulator [Clostridia bacterium]
MNISDMIEEFIKDTLGNSSKLDISRNELANFFNVAPSQINYVLTTRFNYERGFVIESKRGGSGYVTIVRADDSDSKWLREIILRLNSEIDYRSACYIVEELFDRELINLEQVEIIKSAISPQALSNPFRMENKFRAQILKRVILDLKKKKVQQEEES